MKTQPVVLVTHVTQPWSVIASEAKQSPPCDVEIASQTTLAMTLPRKVS
jgi:hypothetical protein